MGCCCSQDDDDVPERDEPDERTPLFQSQPVSTAEVRPVVPSMHPARPTGSETLAQILDRSANAYIDVNAVESRLGTHTHGHSLRSGQYSDRLNSLNSVQSSVKNPHSLPFGVMSHKEVLNEPIISRAEIETVVTTAESLSEELDNMQPKSKEALATFMPS